MMLAIPLSYNSKPDILAWQHEKKGQYTVRSGYGVLRAQRHSVDVSLDEGHNDGIWQKLWKVKAPLKILNLI